MKREAGTWKPRRRHHERAFKAELVRQTLEPGASVAAIAQQHGLNANVLFKWRRDHLRGGMAIDGGSSVLLPVHVLPTAEITPTPVATPTTAAPVTTPQPTGVIELEFAGARLCLRGTVDEATLSVVLRALRHRG